MYARPMQLQTEVRLKILQFLAVTYDMGIVRCAIDVDEAVAVYFLCLNNF